METIKHILVPSDFSANAEQAALHAVAIAAQYGAKITFLHIVTVYDDDLSDPETFFPDIEKFYKHLENRADDKIKQTIETFLHKDLTSERVIQRGFSAFEEILSYAEDHNVDMITMGTHSRKPLARFFIGSVTEKVVHHAQCPVLCTHIHEEKPKPIKPYERILVPVDFSEQSKKALTIAQLFLAENGRIDVLHVIEDNIHPAYYSSETTSLMDFLPDLHDRSQQNIDAMIKENANTVKTRVSIENGPVAKTITEHAEENKADMIVMGTHGLNALEQLFIGNVANKVIRKASCPVMTAK